MEETILFGDKEKFAIELGFAKKKSRYKLRFWTEGIAYGSFTKSSELGDSITQYQKFINEKEKYYRAVFDDFSPKEIMYFLVDFFLLGDTDGITDEEIEKRIELYIFFGEQFTNQTSSLLLLYKKPNVIFIIQRPNDGPVDRYNISFDTFCQVFEEYIVYAQNNNFV
ncbi:hypothetical protein D0C36_04075 [Mucilaginibacter conchicola]|uniref:Uncharacterized protein n=1 Tax=Mucilaginibacter conchicola TaxID=2303333 RepID=A0A372NXU4_9SPHI|nr:hypothetical protein [Mucilaginibacter conchicola]RFZ94724.1 hypothetical protein D0C36_04075 [Mucilaginibacter conchicola]